MQNFSNKTCFVAPGIEDLAVDDLKFKEFSVYVRRALESRGYKTVDTLENAEMIILLAYEISGPQSNMTAMPVYGQTGVSSSTTYGTINSSGYGSASYTGTTYHTPQYGITGYAPISYTTYTRYIKMKACDWIQYKMYQKDVILWETEVISVGSTGDLREVFPVMVAASMPYVGENTGKKIKVVLSENNKQVKFIKGLLN